MEEALLTLQAGQPLFLLGGYGGVTRAIISALQGKKPEQLTADYQRTDKNYAVLMDDFNQRISGQPAVTAINYEVFGATFAAMGVDSLNNGLDEQENQSLFVTTNIEEAIWLILSGLTRINEQKQE